MKIKLSEKSNTIGLFDSGVGGLSVVKELEKINPNYNTIYLGDSANFPYGDKSHDKLLEIIEKDISFLISKDVSHLGIACNTATAVLFQEVPSLLNSPKVFNPIFSLKKYLENNTSTKNILVIGTEYTVNSKIYEHILEPISNLTAIQSSKNLLVEIIEKNKSEELNKEIEKIKDIVEKNKIDTLVLGCTHYNHIKGIFEKELSNINVLDPSELMAKDISQNLKADNGRKEEYFTRRAP